jgi:hypothetical protein
VYSGAEEVLLILYCIKQLSQIAIWEFIPLSYNGGVGALGAYNYGVFVCCAGG